MVHVKISGQINTIAVANSLHAHFDTSIQRRIANLCHQVDVYITTTVNLAEAKVQKQLKNSEQ